MHGEELEQTRDTPFDTRTLPSRVRKILWLQALKYPHGVCAHLIHTKSSLDTERLKRKSLPWSRSIRARLGSITQVSMGLGQTPRRCYVGGAASPFCRWHVDWILWSASPKLLWELPMFNCLIFVLATPARNCLQTALRLVAKAEEQKVASVLRRWKLSIHLFFTVTCSGPHFTKCLVSFIIVSGKENSNKIVLV